MLHNYFKIALRNLLKNKSQTAINIGGLTLGTVCALVIFLIIQYDLSFDTWHNDSDRIHRVVRLETEFGDEGYYRGGPYSLAEAVRNDIAGIEAVTLVDDNTSNNLSISFNDEGGNKVRFKVDFTAFVDSDYFEIFTYEWIIGDPAEALKNPNSAILTETHALKLFGTLNVLGKEFEITEDAGFDLTVTGIVRELPETTDFPFNLFISNNSRDVNGELRTNDNWGSNSSGWQTYIKLAEGIQPEAVNAQFDALITKYQNEERASIKDFFLQPLSEIHFDSRFGTYQNRVIEKRILYALGIIGLFLLVTACINFINLNTAIAVRRSKEVGLRKTLGGTKPQLVIHFLAETAFIVLISIVLGIGVTEIILKGIEPILGFTPELTFANNLPLVLFTIGLFIGISVLAGWYPAHYLSSFNPIEAIRNKIGSNYGQGITLRRGLTVLQLSITQILIITTIIIASQIKFFQENDLGLVQDAVVEINIAPVDQITLDTFKNMLLNQSSITNVSYSNTGTASGNVWGGNYVLFDDSVRKENNVQGKYIDDRFIDTYGLQLFAGEPLALTDTVTAYLANETFARQTGYGNDYEGLLGKIVNFWGVEAPIVGVVKDFNTQSLHEPVTPVLLASAFNYYVAAIKINMQQSEQALASIETAFNTAFPEYIFEYAFLDENINQMYEDEQRTAKIMNAFTIIAIIIGCLGLFGLVSYMATTRTKEIGVRKVLGASIWNILSIFGKELGYLTGFSFIIAAPISYYIMQQWLADFAYRIDVGFEIFGLALMGTLLIAGITVGYKSISAALANPIDSLKTE